MRVNQGRDKRVALNQPASRCQNRVLLILSNFPGSFLEFLTRVAQTAGSAVCGLSLAPPSQKQAPAQPETPRAKPENEPRTPESGVRATIQIKNEFVDSKQLPRFVPSFLISIPGGVVLPPPGGGPVAASGCPTAARQGPPPNGRREQPPYPTPPGPETAPADSRAPARSLPNPCLLGRIRPGRASPAKKQKRRGKNAEPIWPLRDIATESLNFQ